MKLGTDHVLGWGSGVGVGAQVAARAGLCAIEVALSGQP